MDVSKLFTLSDRDKIVGAIVAAEKNTSAEIRVHIDSKCSGSPLDAASKQFAKLNMHKTASRNGVLIYVAIDSRKFAIIGDVGINVKVDPKFWDECYNLMLAYFAKGNYSDGISEAIGVIGNELKKHFCYKCDDVNELSDEISFGKGL